MIYAQASGIGRSVANWKKVRGGRVRGEVSDRGDDAPLGRARAGCIFVLADGGPPPVEGIIDEADASAPARPFRQMTPSKKIVLATFGSLGDLHPFVALAHELKREGFEPVVATSNLYRDLIEREGLGFAPMRPDLDDLCQSLDADLGQIARSMARNDGYLFNKVIFPYLREAYDDIVVASEGAAALVAHSLAFSAQTAAEKLGLPLFNVILSPMMLYSAYDPPMGSRAPFARNPRSRLAFRYNRALLWSLMQALALWARPIARLRREVGLPRRFGPALLSSASAASASLGLFSPTLAPQQPDHPPDFRIVGHTFHDRFEDGDALEPELEAFLAAGDRPIVATLGSFVVHDKIDFFRASAGAARRLGRRIVLMTRDEEREALRSDLQDDAFVAGYAPHSLLFPRASAIIHHGGVGTTGQALRAGAPQLVVPFLGDQADNAGRVARLGVARVLAQRDVAPDRIAQELSALLDREDHRRQALALGAIVSRENGAAAAARIIAEAINSRTP
jgi:rhamnosyltransferase subunit B